MKFEGLTPHSSVGVQTKLMICLIHQNKSVSKHAWNNALIMVVPDKLAKTSGFFTKLEFDKLEYYDLIYLKAVDLKPVEDFRCTGRGTA